MNDLDNMMKTVHFTSHSQLSWGKYITLDSMVTNYLNDVKKSDVDAFGNLVENDSYIRALGNLDILLMLELIEPEEYERITLLFAYAGLKANKRHQRLIKALERRENMRSSVKARRVGVRG